MDLRLADVEEAEVGGVAGHPYGAQQHRPGQAGQGVVEEVGPSHSTDVY